MVNNMVGNTSMSFYKESAPSSLVKNIMVGTTTSIERFFFYWVSFIWSEVLQLNFGDIEVHMKRLHSTSLGKLTNQCKFYTG